MTDMAAAGGEEERRRGGGEGEGGLRCVGPGCSELSTAA